MHLFGGNDKNMFTVIKQKVEQLSSDSSFLVAQKINTLLSLTFPNNSASLFSILYEEAVQSSSDKWTKKFKEAVTLFAPFGQLANSILANRDIMVAFENETISYDQQQFFNQKQVSQLLKMNKEGCSMSLPLLQNLFVNLSLSLVNQRDLQMKGKWLDVFFTDNYYFHIVRNPILHIIRLWLNSYRMHPQIYNRILNVIELFLFKEPMNRIKKGEKNLIIKATHLHGIYVMAEWKFNSGHWQFVYMLGGAIELKNKNNFGIFNCWVGLWSSLMMKGSPYQQRLRNQFSNAIQNTFSVPNLIFRQISDIEDSYEQIAEDNRFFINLLQQTQQILKKQQWTASPQFLYSMLTIIILVKNIAPQNFNSLLSYLGLLLSKLWLTFRDKEPKIKTKQIIELYRKNGGEWVDETEIQNRKQNENRRTTGKGSIRGNSVTRKSLPSHQEIRNFSIWSKPIQSNQSYFMYQAALWLSFKIDKCRGLPTTTDVPITNLRLLAEIKTIVVLFLLIIALRYLIL